MAKNDLYFTMMYDLVPMTFMISMINDSTYLPYDIKHATMILCEWD